MSREFVTIFLVLMMLAVLINASSYPAYPAVNRKVVNKKVVMRKLSPEGRMCKRGWIWNDYRQMCVRIYRPPKSPLLKDEAKKDENASAKGTFNCRKPPKTTENHRKPPKTTENHRKPL